MRVESWFPEWNGMYWWLVKIQYTDRCSGVVEIRPRIPNKALEEDDEHTEAQYDVSRAIRIEFMNLWIGVGDLCDDEDGAKSWHKGNTFLFLERDGVHYVSVTYRVARFSSEENVLYYHSRCVQRHTLSFCPHRKLGLSAGSKHSLSSFVLRRASRVPIQRKLVVLLRESAHVACPVGL